MTKDGLTIHVRSGSTDFEASPGDLADDALSYTEKRRSTGIGWPLPIISLSGSGTMTYVVPLLNIPMAYTLHQTTSEWSAIFLSLCNPED
jgi:hypothetical protein